MQLREQKQGGIAAVVVLPKTLLAPAPAAAVPAASSPMSGSGTHAFSLPGADAEVNSNVLYGRSENGDPLVALAEKAVQRSEGETETPAETTMELLIPEPAADGTEPVESESESESEGEGEGKAETAAAAAAETETEHQRVPDEPEELVTDKGLPKRTPKVTAPTQAPRQRSGSVDAEALRRRLGGFRRGRVGYRDVEAEIAEQTGTHKAPVRESAASEEATGGTVEEASS